ncbi:MAG: helicase-related protein [Gemmatimonadaceae bacterium]
MTAPPNHQPEFVDNRDGNTLERALLDRLDWIATSLRDPVAVDIATGYFNAEGFARVAEALERVGHVRLMLGAEPTPPPARPQRTLADPRGERFERKLVVDALAANQQGLLRDRDRLEFNPATDRAIHRLLDFLASGRIEVRRYEPRFLHGKAFIFRDGQGVIAGSSNFTVAGLTSNLELNLGQYQPYVAQRVQQWFDDLWAESVPFDLAALYAARFEEYDPYLIYLRVLWERYKDELETERTPSGTIHLTQFQNDGLDRARRILARYNGVLIADSVGLGKTFLAGELLRQTIERERKRALLIAPAALRDGTWARFVHRFSLYLETVSYEQLLLDKQLGGIHPVLQSRVDEYSLIVIDEAHAFRHSDTRRAAALRALLRGDPPKQIVLMSATPVNNSLWDLYNLLSYFVGHDSAFADVGIASLKRRFDAAVRVDPFTLKPEVLFDVLDATTVRRTRHFVKKYYPHDRIQLKGGELVTIQFPTPHVEPVTYDLERALPGLLDDLEETLAPDDGEPALTMARYWPSKYRREGDIAARELALVGLVRTGLLKRFESSVRAFTLSLERMIKHHDLFLQGLDRGVIATSDLIEVLGESDDEDVWDAALAEAEPIDVSEYDVTALRRAVRADKAVLQRFHDRASRVRRTEDPKLALLADQLHKISQRAIRLGVTDEEQRNKRKVLIFSHFADTVEWIADDLKERLATDRRLHAYRERMAVVRGTEGYDEVGRKEAVYGFAPISTEAPPSYQADNFDILVTTDILAEGMNLQQASHIINYDLPWNPMRLVQRHGRIDRIGSLHADVFITCIFPDRELERLLHLEHTIRVKLAQAAASIGLDDEVIPGSQAADRSFADAVQEIGRIQRGDATLFEQGGEDPHAHSGEEYRQELRKAIAEGWEERIRALPGAAGSGLRLGTQRGHFFCARIVSHVRFRFVPFETDKPVVRDALGCLRHITCARDTQRYLLDELREAAYSAWARARADILAEWSLATDPAFWRAAYQKCVATRSRIFVEISRRT